VCPVHVEVASASGGDNHLHLSVMLDVSRLDDSLARGLSVAYVDLDVAAAHSLHSAPASSSSDSFWPWSWPMFRQPGSERSQDGGVSTTTGADPFGDTSPNGDASHAGPGGSAASNAPKSLTPEQKREKRARALYLLDPHRIAQLVRYHVTCSSRHSFALY